MARRALLVIALAGGRIAAASAASAEESFDRANAAYGQGRFAEAAAAYREIVAAGVRDVRVEYNLGCAELKLERLGPAVLHLERARRMAPGDPDVLANLAYARERLRGPTVDSARPTALSGIVAIQDRLGADLQAVLLLLAVWAAAGVVVAFGARPGGFRPAAGWLLAAIVAVAIVLGVSWRFTLDRALGAPAAVVLAPVADVLAGPADSNARIDSVREGTLLDVRAEQDGWVQVSLPSGLSGWVRRDALGLV